MSKDDGDVLQCQSIGTYNGRIFIDAVTLVLVGVEGCDDTVHNILWPGTHCSVFINATGVPYQLESGEEVWDQNLVRWLKTVNLQLRAKVPDDYRYVVRIRITTALWR